MQKIIHSIETAMDAQSTIVEIFQDYYNFLWIKNCLVYREPFNETSSTAVAGIGDIAELDVEVFSLFSYIHFLFAFASQDKMYFQEGRKLNRVKRNK